MRLVARVELLWLAAHLMSKRIGRAWRKFPWSPLACFSLAWLAMRNWLQDYQYRTTVQWWVFAIAGLTALAITLITVSFQTIKAAYRNPVKSLRTE